MEINWKRFIHMYGRATDTPYHLDALTTTDARQITAAINHLNSAIVHQSTIVMAAVPVLSVIIENMSQAKIIDPQARKAVIEWLGYMAESVSCVGTEPVQEADDLLLDQLENAETEEAAETFLEGEGFSLYEDTYVWAYDNIRMQADAVLQVLEQPEWLKTEGAEVVRDCWQKIKSEQVGQSAIEVPIELPIWPVIDGVYQLHPLQLTAEKPGDLATLDSLGIEYQLVNGVAALVTTGDLEQLWCGLAIAFSKTGLWPVVTCGDEGDVNIPWGGSGMLDAPQEVTGNAWDYFHRQAQQRGVELTALAPKIISEGPLEFAPAEVPDGHALLIVPCTRPADVPAIVGWQGGKGYGLDGATIGSVLRSWEDRFGMVLMYLDTEDLILQRGGDTDDDQIWEMIVKEHEVFCPCVLVDGFEGDREEFLEEFVKDGCWGLWWWNQ